MRDGIEQMVRVVWLLGDVVSSGKEQSAHYARRHRSAQHEQVNFQIQQMSDQLLFILPDNCTTEDCQVRLLLSGSLRVFVTVQDFNLKPRCLESRSRMLPPVFLPV